MFQGKESILTFEQIRHHIYPSRWMPFYLHGNWKTIVINFASQISWNVEYIKKLIDFSGLHNSNAIKEERGFFKADSRTVLSLDWNLHWTEECNLHWPKLFSEPITKQHIWPSLVQSTAWKSFDKKSYFYLVGFHSGLTTTTFQHKPQ